MAKWFENVTPAQRDFELWLTPEDLASSPAAGRPAIGLDRAAAVIAERHPDRALNYLEAPWDETSTYLAWVTRGFDPWTREGGAGNAYLALDQYSGATLYDGVPGDGNVFDQAWDDWSFPTHTGLARRILATRRLAPTHRVSAEAVGVAEDEQPGQRS